MDELQEDFEILIDAFISSDNEDTKILAQSLYKQAEKAFYIQRVSNRRELLISFAKYWNDKDFGDVKIDDVEGKDPNDIDMFLQQ